MFSWMTRQYWVRNGLVPWRHQAITWTYDDQGCNELTHWGWVTLICNGNLTIIGSDNGLSPGRRQAIIWTNAGILLIGPLGTNFSEMLIDIHTFSFKKIHLKLSSGKWRPFCLGLNVLKRSWVTPVISLTKPALSLGFGFAIFWTWNHGMQLFIHALTSNRNLVRSWAMYE